MAHAFVMMGERAKAEAVHREIEARATSGFVQHTWRAHSALALGLVDEAMEHAIRSVTEVDAFGPWFLRWPGVEVLEAHRRYPELKRLIGL